MRNINKKCVVQNAENKKVVTLKDTKSKEKSSTFGITIIDILKNHPMSYDDNVVRQVIYCIKVVDKNNIQITFKNGKQVMYDYLDLCL